ncbi:cyclase family protein [Burkholderia pseudomallei]|nr:cyclase family protein [Burkholderia pseudomallei]
MERRWKRRPAGANWGEFGDDDQKGRLNWLTERKVLEGMAEVKAGKVFSLSLPLDVPRGGGLNARRQPPRVKGRSRFLLTAPPLHIRGLVGSPVNPVATV